MKLQNNYLGIAFNQSKQFQKLFIDTMMCPEFTKVILEKFSKEDLIERKHVMEQLASSEHQKIYYISQKVQEHAALIKYDKVNLGWFRKLNSRHATYIVGKNEFYRFWINEQSSLHIGHFYADPNFKGTIKDNAKGELPSEWKAMQDLPVTKWDIFTIRLKDYPNGFMPVDPLANNSPKEFFVKLLLFMELSEIVTEIIEPNRKVNINPTAGRNFDNKIKNESSVPVVFVTTNWNKILVVNGGFKVSGHIRLQPCGIGRSEYKLVWIEEYQKTGYMKKAHKERHELSN